MGWEKVSCLESCPQLKVVLIEGPTLYLNHAFTHCDMLCTTTTRHTNSNPSSCPVKLKRCNNVPFTEELVSDLQINRTREPNITSTLLHFN